MKQSFTEAYNTIINLRKNGESVCFLFASQFSRVRQFVEFIAIHSNRSLDYISMSDLSALIARSKSQVSTSRSNDELSRFLAKRKAEYIVFTDGELLPKSNYIFKELCEVFSAVSKRAVVLVCSQYAAELSLIYGKAVMLEIMCPNDHSLKIKPSDLMTEELYLRNWCEAAVTGIFWANADFYNNLLSKKIQGDRLFEGGDYFGAYKLYCDAISYHSTYDEPSCPVHDIILISLYIRCVACFVFGKLTERTDANRLMKKTTREMIEKLKESQIGHFHKQLIMDYDCIFSEIETDTLSKINYLLFLKEYVF